MLMMPKTSKRRPAFMNDTKFDLDSLFESRKHEILTTNSSFFSKGPIYYVSPDGDDENDGKSRNTPWKTLKKVSSAPLVRGSVVLFERNRTFRGVLNCCEGVIYSAYGKGAKPRLFASPENAAYPAAWEKLVGTENIWKYTKEITDCGTLVFDGGAYHSIKEIPSYIDGKYIVRGADIPFDVKKDIRYDLGIFCDCAKVMRRDLPLPDMYNRENTGTLYLRCDKGNPGLLFSSIELCVRENGVIPKNGVTIDNLCIKYAGCHGIGGGNVKGLTVRHCEIGRIGGCVQFYNPDGRVTRYGNGVEIYVSCAEYTVENCYLYEIYDAAITHQFKGKSPSPCTMTNVVYKNNLIENCVYSIEYFLDQDDCDEQIMSDILIENNFMRCAGYGFGTQRPDGTTPAHIKGWDHKNPARNFVIKNNIFDRSGHMMIHAGFADEAFKPQFVGNTYVQNRGGEFLRVGKNPTSMIYFDGNAKENVKNILGDTIATVVFYKGEDR